MSKPPTTLMRGDDVTNGCAVAAVHSVPNVTQPRAGWRRPRSDSCPSSSGAATLDYYANLVTDLRRRFPDATLGSDIIVGFPGETERDFDELRSYLEDSPLTHLHVFPYSDRPGTEASKLRCRVDGAVIRERARCIRETARRLSGRFMQRQHGRVIRALVLDDGMCAVTRNGLKVRLSARRDRNDWVTVMVRTGGDSVTGDVLCA